MMRLIVLISIFAIVNAFLRTNIHFRKINNFNNVILGSKSSDDSVNMELILNNRIFTSLMLGLGLTLSPLTISLSNINKNNHNIVSPLLANADFRAAQKRTYFRFIPKLIEGKEFYNKDLKAAIDKEDWKVVEKFFEEYVSKYNGSVKDQAETTDTYVNSRFFRPMQLFSGTFAERGTSPKQRALAEQLELFKTAMNDLEGCIKDRPGNGFFAAKIKAPTGAERKKQAVDAFKRGKSAYNEYVKVANDGLMLELNKLESM